MADCNSGSDSELDTGQGCSKKIETTYLAKSKTSVITVESSVNISSRMVHDDNMGGPQKSGTGRAPRKTREHGRQWNCRNKRMSRKKINFRYVVNEICDTRETCLDWLKSMGFVTKVMFCPNCNKKMKFEAESDAQDGYIWICKEKECEGNPPKVSIRHGRWFERKDISLVELLLFVYLWCHGYPAEMIMRELNMDESQHREMDSTLCEILYKKTAGKEALAESENKDGKMALALWQKMIKSRDPFIELLKDADSLCGAAEQLNL